jgi:hypothetical protein
VLLFLLPVSFIQAQVGPDTEFRIVQRLAWLGDQYALRYEVVIEREEEGRFRELLREFTNEPFFEVAISPGRYRYRVIPYDLFNRPAQNSNWVSFEVSQALMPELDDALPVFIYVDERAVHTLNISGKNIDPGAEIELRRPGSVPIVPIDKNILRDGSRATLYFNNDQLIPGVYEVRVRNPGGFETRGGTITIALPEQSAQIKEPEPLVYYEPVAQVQQPVKILEIDNIFFNVAWMPMFPIYGQGDWFYGWNPALAGATARLGVVADMKLIYVGMELTGSWYAFDTGSYELSIRYKGDNGISHTFNANSSGLSMHFMSFGFNLLTQKRYLGGRLGVVFRVGGGASIFLAGENENTGHTENSSTSGMAPIYVDIGVSLDWLITTNFYLETGIDYYHWFTDSPSGCLRPWIGMGLKF